MSVLINVDKAGSIDGLKAIFDAILKNNEVKGLLILACDENNFTPGSIDHILQKIPIPIFGGIFPQIIYGKEKLSKGTIVAGLTTEPDVNIITDLSDSEVNYDDAIDERIPQIGDAKTMFVLVDGYSKRVTDLIDSLFNIFGVEINFIGGGAGSIDHGKVDMKQGHCLFSNKGLLRDCAILALANIDSGVGVCHGWDNQLSGPHKVTECDGNTIESLDWKPAFEVYKKVVEKYSGKTFTNDNFFEIAKGYPFGLKKLETERIVRDPFTVTENGYLTVATAIPPESFVDILSGDIDSLVNAAGKAHTDALQAFGGKEAKSILCFDCISRVLFLEDNFSREIDAVYRHNTPLVGALSIGEIANSGKDYLEMYNKTCVVGVLAD